MAEQTKTCARARVTRLLLSATCGALLFPRLCLSDTATETAGSKMCTGGVRHLGAKDLRTYAKEHIGSHIHADHAGWAVDLAIIVTGANTGYACDIPSGCDIGKVKKMNVRDRLCGNDWPPFGYSMVGLVRLANVAQLIADVVESGVQGDFAELGVWRGGVCIFAQKLFGMLEPLGDRNIYVFDAFDKIPGYGRSKSYLENSAADVQQNFEVMGAWTKAVKFQVGLFENTTKLFRDTHDVSSTRLAILRIDGNFYDSYQDALYRMYEYVPVGGYVIFDDVMTHRAVMRCWEDFRSDHFLPETLTRIDKHSAYFKKVANTPIDQSKMHPAQDANKHT